MKNMWILVILTVLIIGGCSESSMETETFSIEHEMVLVPAGSFEMGNTYGGGNTNEYPVHTVSVDAFYMSNTEVTQGQYKALMGDILHEGYGIGDNYPVYRVSWEQALEYCNLLSAEEELAPCYNLADSTCNWNATGYRLPTEAEWEYAAKKGTNSEFPGSDDIDRVAWYQNNSENQTHQVGQKEPNSLGVYDMSGNVWEWCWDWYDSSYYEYGESNNPHGPEEGEDRMARGGCWFSDMNCCCCSFRSVSVSHGSNYIGFRVVRNTEPKWKLKLTQDTQAGK